VERAGRAADFVLAAMRPGPLLHAWRGGRGEVPAFLADYAFLVHGLLALHDATAEERWLAAAAELTAEQRRRLAHEDGGYYTAEERADLLFRGREVFDGATPSANGIAVLNLLALAERTGEPRWRTEAERALRAFAPLVEGQPAGARTLAVAVWRYHGGAGLAGRAAEPSRSAAGPSPASDGGGARPAPATGAEPTSLRPGTAGPAALAAEAAAVVRARLELEPEAADGWRPFRLVLDVAPGWHVTGAGGPAGMVPVAVEEVDCELRDVAFPEPERLAAGGVAEPLPVHAGRVVASGRLRPLLRAGAPRVRLRYQACDDTRCLPPVERVVQEG
jgi:hypothetical protein